MAENSAEKQGGRGKPFAKGVSGNPAGVGFAARAVMS